MLKKNIKIRQSIIEKEQGKISVYNKTHPQSRSALTGEYN